MIVMRKMKNVQRNVNEIQTIIEPTFNYDFSDQLSSIESNSKLIDNDGNLYLSCISFINAVNY